MKAISSDNFDFTTCPKKKRKSRKGAKSVKSLAVDSICDFPKPELDIECLSPKTQHSTPGKSLKTFAEQLKSLPLVSVEEKLNFPLKFERDRFFLDFNSGRGSSSDTDPGFKVSTQSGSSSLKSNFKEKEIVYFEKTKHTQL